jgi:hypothetical protein
MNSNNQSQNRLEYFQNLGALSGIQELSDGAAATCSGGTDIILYDNDNFSGSSKAFTDDIGNFVDVDFNDRTESISVRNGVWEVYVDRSFKGADALLTDGDYTARELRAKGINPNTISSINRVA